MNGNKNKDKNKNKGMIILLSGSAPDANMDKAGKAEDYSAYRQTLEEQIENDKEDAHKPDNDVFMLQKKRIKRRKSKTKNKNKTSHLNDKQFDNREQRRLKRNLSERVKRASFKDRLLKPIEFEEEIDSYIEASIDTERFNRHRTEIESGNQIDNYMIYFRKRNDEKDLVDRYAYLKIFLSPYGKEIDDKTKLRYEYLKTEIVASFIPFFAKTLNSLYENRSDIEFLNLDIDKSLDVFDTNGKLETQKFIDHYINEFKKMICYYATECMKTHSQITNTKIYRILKSYLTIFVNDNNYFKLAISRVPKIIKDYALKEATENSNSVYDFKSLLEKFTSFLDEKKKLNKIGEVAYKRIDSTRGRVIITIKSKQKCFDIGPFVQENNFLQFNLSSLQRFFKDLKTLVKLKTTDTKFKECYYQVVETIVQKELFLNFYNKGMRKFLSSLKQLAYCSETSEKFKEYYRQLLKTIVNTGTFANFNNNEKYTFLIHLIHPKRLANSNDKFKKIYDSVFDKLISIEDQIQKENASCSNNKDLSKAKDKAKYFEVKNSVVDESNDKKMDIEEEISNNMQGLSREQTLLLLQAAKVRFNGEIKLKQKFFGGDLKKTKENSNLIKMIYNKSQNLYSDSRKKKITTDKEIDELAKKILDYKKLEDYFYDDNNEGIDGEIPVDWQNLIWEYMQFENTTSIEIKDKQSSYYGGPLNFYNAFITDMLKLNKINFIDIYKDEKLKAKIGDARPDGNCFCYAFIPQFLKDKSKKDKKDKNEFGQLVDYVKRNNECYGDIVKLLNSSEELKNKIGNKYATFLETVSSYMPASDRTEEYILLKYAKYMRAYIAMKLIEEALLNEAKKQKIIRDDADLELQNLIKVILENGKKLKSKKLKIKDEQVNTWSNILGKNVQERIGGEFGETHGFMYGTEQIAQIMSNLTGREVFIYNYAKKNENEIGYIYTAPNMKSKYNLELGEVFLSEIKNGGNNINPGYVETKKKMEHVNQVIKKILSDKIKNPNGMIVIIRNGRHFRPFGSDKYKDINAVDYANLEIKSLEYLDGISIKRNTLIQPQFAPKSPLKTKSPKIYFSLTELVGVFKDFCQKAFFGSQENLEETLKPVLKDKGLNADEQRLFFNKIMPDVTQESTKPNMSKEYTTSK